MTLIRDIAFELVGMFLADARLTGAILVLVGFVVGLRLGLGVEPIIGGGVLLIGCLAILIESAARETRNHRRAENR